MLRKDCYAPNKRMQSDKPLALILTISPKLTLVEYW